MTVPRSLQEILDHADELERRFAEHEPTEVRDQDARADPAEMETAWRHEITTRVDDIVAGRVELVDADETYQILSAELAAKRA